MLSISLDDVELSFDLRDGTSLKVLDGVSLHVAPGEFVSLIGPSGCGKSTILNLLAGILAPTRGTIRIGEDEVGSGRGGIARRLAYVFQRPRLLNWRTVRQNLEIIMRATDIPVDEHPGLIKAALEQVGLEGFADSYPMQLSGGMQQRVALARALVISPEVILMDEPLGALDAITATRVRGLLAEVCANSGATVLYVTHSIHEAVELSDRVILMYDRPTSVYREVRVPLPRPRYEMAGEGSESIWRLADEIKSDFFANVVRPVPVGPARQLAEAPARD